MGLVGTEYSLKINELATKYGNKSANLIFMLDKDIPVSPICPIENDLLVKFLNEHAPKWLTLWDFFKKSQKDHKASLTEESCKILEELRNLIVSTFEKHHYENEAIKKYLKNNFDPNEVLMIRSTGKEDSKEVANPGGNESYPSSTNEIELSKKIGMVIASYFSEKSLQQRLKAEQYETIMNEPPFIPVLLHKMVGEIGDNFVYSGVMYVNEHGTFIQVAPGHGELVVNSKGPVDSYFVTKEGIIHQQIYEKPFRMKPKMREGEVSLKYEKNSDEIANTPSLPIEQVTELNKLGLKIIEYYGDRRDIEFAYIPKEKKIYIVQSRPIQDEKKVEEPRAIKSGVLNEVKQKSTVYRKMKVIVSANRRAQVAHQSNEIIMANTISDALEVYLKMTKEKAQTIKGVLIERDAPPTSHEAAVFNSVSIPVFHGSRKDIRAAQEVMENNTNDIILDPQRGIVACLSKDEQCEQKFLEVGYFKSTLTAERTLFELKDISFFINEEAKERILSYAKNENADKKMDECLETIETVTQNSIVTARTDLGVVLKKFNEEYKKSLRNKDEKRRNRKLKEKLYEHAAIYAKNIDDKLNEIESSGFNTLRQKQLLDLVNALEAIIFNAKKRGMFSDSMYQLEYKEKIENRLLQMEPRYKMLMDHKGKRAHVIDLAELSGSALNDELEKKWINFVLTLAHLDPSNIKKEKFASSFVARLESIVEFVKKNEAELYFVNILFHNLESQKLSSGKILEEMERAANDSKEYKNYLFKLEVKIAAIESQCVLWQEKRNHAKLIKTFSNDIFDILKKIENLNKQNNLIELPFFAKVKIISELEKLIESIDVSIKNMKGCPDYNETDERVKVEFFYQMLESYRQLMNQMLNYIPPDYHFKNDKSKLMNVINTKFTEKKDSTSSRELSTSANFSVDSVVVDSALNFSEMIGLKNMTLEDLFTLFHQNSITAISYFKKRDLTIDHTLFPQELQRFLELLNENICRGLSLSSLNMIDGRINLSYNIPLQCHASKLFISFNTEDNSVEIRHDIYASNADYRLDMINAVCLQIPRLLNNQVKIVVEPKKGQNDWNLTSTFSTKLPNDKIQDFFKIIGLNLNLTFFESTPYVMKKDKHSDRNGLLFLNIDFETKLASLLSYLNDPSTRRFSLLGNCFAKIDVVLMELLHKAIDEGQSTYQSIFEIIKREDVNNVFIDKLGGNKDMIQDGSHLGLFLVLRSAKNELYDYSKSQDIKLIIDLFLSRMESLIKKFEKSLKPQDIVQQFKSFYDLIKQRVPSIKDWNDNSAAYYVRIIECLDKNSIKLNENQTNELQQYFKFVTLKDVAMSQNMSAARKLFNELSFDEQVNECCNSDYGDFLKNRFMPSVLSQIKSYDEFSEKVKQLLKKNEFNLDSYFGECLLKLKARDLTSQQFLYINGATPNPLLESLKTKGYTMISEYYSPFDGEIKFENNGNEGVKYTLCTYDKEEINGVLSGIKIVEMSSGESEFYSSDEGAASSVRHDASAIIHKALEQSKVPHSFPVIEDIINQGGALPYEILRQLEDEELKRFIQYNVLKTAIAKSNYSFVKELLNSGYKVNCHLSSDEPLLDFAKRKSSVEVQEILSKHLSSKKENKRKDIFFTHGAEKSEKVLFDNSSNLGPSPTQDKKTSPSTKK